MNLQFLSQNRGFYLVLAEKLLKYSNMYLYLLPKSKTWTGQI